MGVCPSGDTAGRGLHDHACHAVSWGRGKLTFERIKFGDGTRKELVLVVGDTNLFLQDAAHQVGADLEAFLSGKTKIVFKEVKREIGKRAKMLERVCKTVKIGQLQYGGFLEHIRLLQKQMANNPSSQMSRKWLRKKTRLRRLADIDEGVLVQHLLDLGRNADRVDNKILAKAAALSMEYRTYFLSRDWDHLVIACAIESHVTGVGGRLSILNPKRVDTWTNT